MFFVRIERNFSFRDLVKSRNTTLDLDRDESPWGQTIRRNVFNVAVNTDIPFQQLTPNTTGTVDNICYVVIPFDLSEVALSNRG